MRIGEARLSRVNFISFSEASDILSQIFAALIFWFFSIKGKERYKIDAIVNGVSV
jgi:hypothetical protein